MKSALLLLLLSVIAGGVSARETGRISETELKLGGIAIGLSEAEVRKLAGPPRERENTGEGFKLGYPGLLVYVGADGHGVYDLVSTNPKRCTPSKVCPGMAIDAVNRLYGRPEVAVRETGTFIEYYPKGISCWLQVSAPQGVVISLRIACQP